VRRFFRPLDGYIFGEFWRIFVATALGLPILVVIIDLTDQLGKYLDRELPRADIALSYLFWIPESMFLVLPAAVLFATVFTIGAITRHSEITAAKASGISFYRMIAPIFVGAFCATLIGLALGELVPIANARRLELLREDAFQRGNERYNFTYAAEHGRVYKVAALRVDSGHIDGIEIERKGIGPDYPTYIITARTAAWDSTAKWTLTDGYMHIIPDSVSDFGISFKSLVDNQLAERPGNLTARDKAPQDMGFRELGRFISAMERSGADANELRVERMLKIAIPVTCMIIVLFGAPLATSTQRGGAAYGVGVSLGTTVIFLIMIQLMKAVGGKGVINPPEIAAWIPSVVFAVVGSILLARVRT
jgi:lipopolysaccharide export system permease protein